MKQYHLPNSLTVQHWGNRELIEQIEWLNKELLEVVQENKELRQQVEALKEKIVTLV